MLVFLAILLTLAGSPNGSLPNSAPPVAYDGMSGFPGAAVTAPPPASGPSDDGMSGFPGH
jgi:hypothetical protein